MHFSKIQRYAILVAAAAMVAAGWWWPQSRSVERFQHEEKQPPSPAVIALKPALPAADADKAEEVANLAKEPPLSDAAMVIASRWERETQVDCVAFREWAKRFVKGSGAVAEGVKLAEARRAFLKDAIKTEPLRVLQAAVPWSVRSRLPAEVVSLLEQRVDGAGDLMRMGTTPVPGREPAEAGWMEAYVNATSYRAYPTGPQRKRSLGWAALHGVAFDRLLALTDSPVRALEADEPFVAGREIQSTCPVSGITTTLETLPATSLGQAHAKIIDAGHAYVRVCDASHKGRVERLVRKKEGFSSPWISGKPDLASGGDAADSFLNTQPSAAWTTGTKKLLIIRVDYSDRVGTPINSSNATVLTEQAVVNIINRPNGVRDFYSQGSFNRTTINVAAVDFQGDSADVTPVLRMPKTAEYYATNGANREMHTDAENAAAAAGFNLAAYQRIGLFFSDLSNINNSLITYGGLGNVEGPNFWINGYAAMNVVAHELGHTFGLPHASRVQTTTNDPLGNGVWQEYGDELDVMGDAQDIAGHFNMWSKAFLHWIDDPALKLVTTSGVYRVGRFDHVSANPASGTLPLALRIPRQAGTEYWIGHREAPSNNSYATNGAYILWARSDGDNTRLIDCNGPNDSVSTNAPLTVGQTLNDSAEGITIKTVARGGSGATAWVDVQVTFATRIDLLSTTPVADEYAGPFNLLLLRSKSVANNVTGSWSTEAITATANVDYTQSTGTITWTPGDAAPVLLQVPVLADAIDDNNESFRIKLSSVNGAVLPAGTTPLTVLIRQPGAVDTSFRNSASTTMPTFNNNVQAVAPDGQGRVLVGGYFYNFGAAQLDCIARLNQDGSEDTTFVPSEITNSGGPVRSIAFQSTGKIIIGGGFSTTGSAARLARLNEDGSIDDTFDPGSGPGGGDVFSLAVQPDDKILVAGSFTSFNGSSRRGIVRLNADGSLDSTFANPALSPTMTPAVFSVRLLSTNKVLIGGSFVTSSTSPYHGGVARLNDDGTLDGSFASGDGIATSAFFNNGYVNAVAELASGKLVVGGNFASFDGHNRFQLAMLSADGAVDSAAPGVNNVVNCILPLPDGSAIVGGVFDQSTSPSVFSMSKIGRILANGTWDTAFNNLNEVDADVYALSLEPEGRRIIGVGSSSTFGIIGYTPVYRIISGLPPVQPVITTQPSGVTVDEDTTLTLSVGINVQRHWVQWFHDGEAVPGASSLVYSKAASPSDNGSWQARIVTPYGTAVTNAVMVNVRFQPVVTTQPGNVIVNAGSIASFSVAAKGGDLTYQWQRDGLNIDGATSATYSFTALATDSESVFRCVVTNALGVADSGTAQLTVVTTPTIIAHPSDAAILVGQSTTLAVSASGLFLSYQWKKDTVNISGATSPTYTVSNATTSKAGSYTCVITNSAGSVTSDPGHVHVVVKPVVTTQPLTQLRPANGPVTFTVIASGEFLSYQWQKGTSNISGANASSYTIGALASTDAGAYRCVVSNMAGSATSSSATLTVYPPPTITKHPVSLFDVPRGKSSTFAVTATGTFLSYQWQLNGSDIPGAVGSSITVAYPDTAHEGAYRCLVSNAAGVTPSNVATLNVIQPPQITAQPSSLTLDAGQSGGFTITAAGDHISFQWQKNGIAIPGATTAALNLSNVTNADVASYRCVVTNVAGSATSDAAALTVNGLPEITQQPLNVAAEAGSNVTINVAANGAGLSYQWKRNGADLTGKTSASLNFASFASANAGTYTCVISNGNGSVTSRGAVLSLVSTLGSSVDDTSRKWQSLSHGAHWANQTATRHDSSDALKTGAMLDGETCTLKTTVTGPVLVRFWRKVSSQSGSDLLRYTVDGAADPDVPDASGEVDWQECLSLVPTGLHELAWSYQKDGSGFYGSDAAWIDQFSTSIPAYITAQPQNLLALAGTTAHFEVGVRTLGTTYQWRRNGVSIAGATSRTLDLTTITTASTGDYSVMIGGKLLSSSAKLLVAGYPAATRVASNATGSIALPLGGTTFTSFQWHAPGGAALANNARISGATTSKVTIGNITVPDEGDYVCRVTAFTPSQTVDVTPCVLGIVTRPDVTASNPPGGIVSGSFSWQLSATQYPTGYTVSGLPSGLTYDSVSGVISGVPNSNGTFSVTVVAKNAAYQSFSRNYALSIATFPAGATGAFSALIARDASNDGMGGFLTLNVTSSGSYTGTLKQGAKSYSLNGRALATTGGGVSIATSYTPSGSTAKTVSLVFDPSHETLGGTIAGTAGVDGAKHVWTTSRAADSYSGSFNCAQDISAPQQGDIALPQGSGYTQMSVNRLGPVTITGKLPDGVAITTSATVWPDGRVPVWVMLYSNHGSLHGTQTVSAGHVSGTLTWSKNGPSGTSDKTYAGGFANNVSLITDGAPWVTAAPVLGLANARVVFSEANVGAAAQAVDLDQLFTITSANVAQFNALTNLASIKLTFTPSSGLFTGSFSITDPVNVKRTGTVAGVLLSHRSQGCGYVLLPSLSGTQILSGRTLIKTP